MKLRTFVIIGALTLGLAACGEPAATDYVTQGNQYFSEQKYGPALQEYKEAVLIAPDKPEPSVNMGNTRYELGDYLGSIEAPKSVLETADPEIQAIIYYNQGNAHFRLQELDKAVEAYKQALRINPADADAKYNLELAEFMQEQQQQQQQAGGDQPEEQPQDEGEQPPEEQPQPGNGDQPPEQPQPGNGDQEQPQNNPPPANLSPEQAERALDRLRRDEDRQADDNYDNYAVDGDQENNGGPGNSDTGW